MTRTFPTALLLLLLVLPLGLHAQQRSPTQEGQFVEQGDYRVHFAALNSLDIPPATARALSVRRSGQRALLVINAQRRLADGSFESVRATASGQARNLLGQDKGITLRSVRDQGTWYVLADFGIYEREHIRFDLVITIDGESETIPLRFDQPFYRG